MFKSSMDILINVNWFKKVDFFFISKAKDTHSVKCFKDAEKRSSIGIVR